MTPSSASHVFHRHLSTSYPTAMRGDGVYLFDSAGKRYLDASGGAAVSCLGHSNAAVIAAVQAQVGQLAYAHSSFFTTEPMEQLADFLVARAPQGLDSVYFVSGGSEAVETALKLARQYFVELGQPERRHIIARRQSYHGNTLGALAAGGNAWRRQQFDPLLIDVEHIAPCYAYRDQRPGETTPDYVGRLGVELEQTIMRLGPGNVMAFIAEPVVGATLGAVPAVDGYLRQMAAICRRHGVLLILDEVMCGMGRTGTLFACEHDGVTADLICIAKGLGAGYQPIGAVMVSQAIRAAIRDGSGFFQHGHTYIGHAQELGAFCRYRTGLPLKLSELAILVTAAKWQCQAEWHIHHPIAIEAGLAPRIAEALRTAQHGAGEPPGIDDDERLVWRFASELYDSKRVSDASYAALVARFGLKVAVNLAALLGYYSLVAMTLNVFNMRAQGQVDLPFAE